MGTPVGRCDRRPAATLRQELVLRMAAMARFPQLVDYELTASVVHPADRELRARCAALGGGPDAYEEASLRLVVNRGPDLVASARLTLWSPIVGFMIEHEPLDRELPLALGPAAAELSAVTVSEPDERERAFLALAMLGARVAAAYGIELLYVVGAPSDVHALDGFDAVALSAKTACIDLHTQAWEPRRAG